jgi:hypothetical protein
MAKYQAIAATEIAVRLMLENAALDWESSDGNVELFQADKLQNPSSAAKRRVFGTRVSAASYSPSIHGRT